jgi:hypothetical protein
MEVALVMLNDKLKAHGIDLGKTTTAYTILATAQANGIITSSQFRDAVAAFGKEWEKAHPWVQQVALDLSENKENMDAFRSAMAAADAGGVARRMNRKARMRVMGASHAERTTARRNPTDTRPRPLCQSAPILPA